MGARREQQQAQSAKYAAAANQEIHQSCIGLEPVSEAECIREVIEATHEHDRAERDLVAQYDMALWAFWMLVVSGTATLLTAAGVWMIYRTLLHTAAMARDTKVTAQAAADGVRQAELANQSAQAAAESAWKIGQAQTRAYVTVADLYIARAVDPPMFKLKFSYTNTGIGTPQSEIAVFWAQGLIRVLTPEFKAMKPRALLLGGDDPNV